MRSYKMTLYIEKLKDTDFDGLQEFVDDTLDGAVDISFTKAANELEASFHQDLAGGEDEEDFLFRIAKSIWEKLGRYTPLGLNAIDLQSPAWDTYEEGDDRGYFEDVSSEYYKTTEDMYKE